MNVLRRIACVLLVLAVVGEAAAHDSWLAKDDKGRWTVVTGSRYPLADAGAHPVQPTCRARGGASACWTQLAEHTIVMEPALVDVYLKEIRPPQAQLDEWAAMKEAGLPWRESYRKFARIETGVSGVAAARQAVREPAGQPLEVVVEGSDALRAGQPASFRVLEDGKPLAGFAIELVSARSPIGVWQRSDADGRVKHVLPFAGDWVLRGTLLERDGDQWRSKFVTLAFAVER